MKGTTTFIPRPADLLERIDQALARMGRNPRRSHTWLCLKAGIDRYYLRNLVRHPHQRVNVDNMSRIAAVLGVPLAELIGEGQMSETVTLVGPPQPDGLLGDPDLIHLARIAADRAVESCPDTPERVVLRDDIVVAVYDVLRERSRKGVVIDEDLARDLIPSLVKRFVQLARSRNASWS
jgi:hypothetical protein